MVRAGQKAPSAKRRIKTGNLTNTLKRVSNVRKHRAPNGALRQGFGFFVQWFDGLSESTERQKVH